MIMQDGQHRRCAASADAAPPLGNGDGIAPEFNPEPKATAVVEGGGAAETTVACGSGVKRRGRRWSTNAGVISTASLAGAQRSFLSLFLTSWAVDQSRSGAGLPDDDLRSLQ